MKKFLSAKSIYQITELFLVNYLNQILMIGIIVAVAIAIIIGVVIFVVIPLSQPHNPETIAWLNQAECDELLDWINERKGTLEKYQSTAQGIYDYKECGK